jgi:hypothetical protein
MPTAAALLLIATVLGANETTLDATGIPSLDEATAASEPLSDAAQATVTAEPELPGTGAGDPLYDRLFAEQEIAAPQGTTPAGPQLPPWLWLVGVAGLGGAYWLRQRQRQADPKPGQVEVLGHTRMGAKARLTVIRVPGEDGRMRRLLVSTGDGTPALVADLGAEGESVPAQPITPAAVASQPALPSEAPRFHRALDEAVQLEADIIDDDEIDLPEGAALGRVPPPRVPVWNELPEEFEGTAGPARPEPAAAPHVPKAQPPVEPIPAEPATPASPLEALEALLGDDDAPELVMDVSWDPETGWSGLPELSAGEAEVEAESEPHPTTEEPEDSWEDLLDEQTPDSTDPLARVGVKPASRAAFEALLGGGHRQPVDIPRNGRIRPVVHTVKPVRPRQQPSSRRTPYDNMLVDERDEVVLDDAPAFTPTHRPRSVADVHDLVAEVLEERGDPAPDAVASSRGNGVVELARYLRRQVAP